MSYEDQTKDELQDELRERDLQVSGTKDELIERLEEDDAASEDGSDGQDDEAGGDPDEQRSQDGDGGGDDRSSQRRGLKPRDAVRSAARELRELGGREVDGVAGFERFDGGWRVLLEVVEVARVPSSTDVLGAYEVTIDDDGELVGYERIRRFVRGQAGGDDE